MRRHNPSVRPEAMKGMAIVGRNGEIRRIVAVWSDGSFWIESVAPTLRMRLAAWLIGTVNHKKRNKA